MTRKGTEVVPFEELSFWALLQQDEQATIRKETEAARSARNEEMTAQTSVKAARWEVGEHLLPIRKILKEERRWLEFVRSELDISVASTYRYMEEARKAQRLVPKPLKEVAKEKGYNLPPRAIEMNPPPDTD